MSIRAIDKTSIHRITSGQVVIDLQTAVKELLENSLDAGATTIDVRFKDYGLKSIEVIDNGHGIREQDYESIALKHHTSKLATYEDLAGVMTFGFRGEALSSLCALSSSLVVTTATADKAPMGTVLEFERSGLLKSHAGKAARQRGTTVMISGLFQPLPVRRKEFERNAKREFAKALTLLHAYALVPCTKGVRLTVSNHPDKGSRSVQLRTDGSSSLKASVSTLWGPKALDNLVPLDLQLGIETERASILKKRGFEPNASTKVLVKGLISKFAIGCGRTSADRQFFFVNGRPCNPGKVQKAFNEVYRTFNIAQTPCVIADFQLPTDACDINVSPDKRTIFIHSENNLIQALKTALEDAFSTSRSIFSVNNASASTNTSQPEPRRDSSSHEAEKASAPAKATSTGKSSIAQEESDELDVEEQISPRKDAHPSGSRRASLIDPMEKPSKITPTIGEDEQVDKEPRQESSSEIQPEILHQSPETEGSSCAKPSHNRSSASTTSRRHSTPLFIPDSPISSPRTRSISPTPAPEEEDDRPPKKRLRTSSPTPAIQPKTRPVQLVLETQGASWNMTARGSQQSSQKSNSKPTQRSGKQNIRTTLTNFAMPGSQAKSIDLDEEENDEEGDEEEETRPVEDSHVMEEDELQSDLEEESSRYKSQDPKDSGVQQDEPMIVDLTGLDPDPEPETQGTPTSPASRSQSLEEEVPAPSRTEIVRTAVSKLALRLDLERLTAIWSRAASAPERNAEDGDVRLTPCVHPAAGVSNAGDAKGAEDELSRVIHKEDFASMDILGQFNLGFIIARLRRDADGKGTADDLFIVDQHAADEKYNFETLQQTTKIESQKLFRPRPLELTAADELVAIENVDVLRSNGFEVSIDEDAASGTGERVKLVAQPVSKSTTFDMQDLSELLHLMQDRPSGQMVRCSKARAMFASRACRKSVMVGMPLTAGQMTSVVRHMGTMDQPWNCPHGRPTMRHLVSLSSLNEPPSSRRAVDWSNFAR